MSENIREKQAKRTLQWGVLALVTSVSLMAAKMGVYAITGSMAVLSDALESIINIVTSSFALYAVWLASHPRDSDHPYGHGRIEYIAQAAEGVAVGVAGMSILVVALSQGASVEALGSLNLGLGLMAIIAAVTLAAGTALIWAGRSLKSPTLEADGVHIRADAFTTIGALAGLGLVELTGMIVFDVIVALLIGVWLSISGLRLLRLAVFNLMDSAAPETLDQLARAFAERRRPGWIAPHLARVHRLGQDIHVDMHMVFPRFWSLEDAHDAATELETAVQERFGPRSDLSIHMEACTPVSCRYCDYKPCPVRSEPQREFPMWTGSYISWPIRHGREEELDHEEGAHPDRSARNDLIQP